MLAEYPGLPDRGGGFFEDTLDAVFGAIETPIDVLTDANGDTTLYCSEEEDSTANASRLAAWARRSWTPKLCPHCKSWIRRSRYQIAYDTLIGDNAPNRSTFRVAACSRCTYWQFAYTASKWSGACVGPGLSLDRFRIYAIANVATFKEKLSLELAGELAKAIRAKKRSWKELSPKDLELLTTAVFKASEGVAEAIHMGKPDDGGIDVIMVDSGQRKWLIQCKHHFGDDHTEPVDTVRNILGVMSNYPSRYGMVVSTADHFSYRAEQAQSRAGELGNTVFLYDRGKLDRLLPPLLPDRPWLAITDDLEPRASLYFEERIASCGQLHLDLEDVKQ